MNSAFVFGQVAEFGFKKTLHKFPKINEGEEVSHYFVFTNTGNAPLLIHSYAVSCNCTSVVLPTSPVLPGKMDSIKVTFNSNGKYWHQDRTIVLSSNAKKKEYVLRFKVYVVPKDEKK